jgi:hypothetical protein
MFQYVTLFFRMILYVLMIHTESLQAAPEGILPMAQPKELDAKWAWASSGGGSSLRLIHGLVLPGMSAARHQPSRRLEG